MWWIIYLLGPNAEIEFTVAMLLHDKLVLIVQYEILEHFFLSVSESGALFRRQNIICNIPDKKKYTCKIPKISS